MKFKKATKELAKARIALFGPAGAGKTYSALRIAKGLGVRIAVIDTERGRASKYGDVFEFDVLELIEKDIDRYIEAIQAAIEGNYDVLIIDSSSHAWKELLQEVERIAKTRYSGNTWSAWSEGTPKQMRFIDALLSFPGHVITTMRSKTEWIIEKDDRTGKSKPVRVGLSPEQGKGIEYEFDLLLEINPDHIATVIKDSTGGKFQDEIIEKPDESFGERLLAWLKQGKKPDTSIDLSKYGNETARSYEFLKDSLERCRTSEDLDAISKNYKEAVEKLPEPLKKEILKLGKNMRKKTSEEESLQLTEE